MLHCITFPTNYGGQVGPSCCFVLSHLTISSNSCPLDFKFSPFYSTRSLSQLSILLVAPCGLYSSWPLVLSAFIFCMLYFIWWACDLENPFWVEWEVVCLAPWTYGGCLKGLSMAQCGLRGGHVVGCGRTSSYLSVFLLSVGTGLETGMGWRSRAGRVRPW